MQRHRALGIGTVEHAGPYQRPAGLVVVLVARFDEGDAQFGVALEQAGSHCAAGRASADHQNVVTRCGGKGRGGRKRLVDDRLPVLLHARQQAAEVVAGLLGSLQQHLWVEMVCLGQRPE